MSEINTSYNNRVRYVMTHRVFGQVVIPEPKGWESDRFKLKRNDEFFGIVNEFSSDLKFYGIAKEMLLNVYNLEGVNAELVLTKQVLELDVSIGAQPNSMLWKNSNTGLLDFDTYIQLKNVSKIRYNSSALIRKIKSNENEKIELERTTDLDNVTIDKIRIDEFATAGKEILFVTKYKQNTSILTYQTAQSSGAPNEATAIPFVIYSDSGEVTVSPHEIRIPISGSQYTTGNIGNMLYLISKNDQTIKLDIDFTVTYWSNSSNSLWMDIVIYENGTNLDFKLASLQNLVTQSYPGGGVGNIETISFKGIIDLPILAGESVAISLKSQGVSDMHWIFDREKSKLVITEDSFAEPTVTKFVTAHAMFKTLFEVIGGKGTSFQSNYFGSIDLGYKADGDGSFIGVTSGNWLRGFQENVQDDNDEYKPITISLKDATKSALASLGLGFGITTLNNKEIAFIEPIEFFFQPTIIIKLPNQINNAERPVYSKLNFSGLKFGYKKPNVAVSLYEEAQGLDEPNTANNYTTPLNRTDNKYEQISTIRADDIGAELARRKPQSQFPTTDTRFDLDSWWTVVKKSGNSFIEMTWDDFFAILPKGIYSPETSSRLWFSPINMLLRHAKYFGAGFLKNASDFIMYGSSLSNSNLRTQLIGGIERGESDNILVSGLDRSILKADKIKFEHFVDDNLLRLLQGSTTIKDANGNDITVPNFYFKVQFLNEEKEWETGYINSVEPKGKGKWELILSNDNVI